jgi:hypothetical protein
MAPDAGEGWGGLSAGHVVSRSVRDSALMLDCTAGLEPGDPMNARISAANTTRSCNMRWKVLGREPNANDVEAATWAVFQRGLKISGVEYVEAIAAAHAAGARWAPSSPAMT